MKLYDYVRTAIKSQIDQTAALQALYKENGEPGDSETLEDTQEALMRDSLSMAIAVMARMEVLDDLRNDQCQASARELVRLLAKRLDIDVEDKYGVPL